MTLRVRALRLRSVTEIGSFGADLSFVNGLNVITAPNTSGKSTAAQAILYALGLEAMLGPAREAPLPHAMTHTIEDENGVEHVVLESQVILEIECSSGQPLTIRRYVKHPSVDSRLVSVWFERIDAPSTPASDSRDFLLKDAGAATREAGFHHFLANEMGWKLPEVPRCNGGSGPLYVEAVAPLFYVEQKRGWGGIQFLTPTQFQIRDVRRRAVEFILDLDVQERGRRIAELRSLRSDIGSKWGEAVGELTGAADAIGANVSRLPQRPASEWPLELAPRVEVVDGQEWTPIDSIISRLQQELEDLESTGVPRVADTASHVARQLAEMEEELRLIRASSTENAHELVLEEATAADAQERLAALEEDIRRHQDLRRLSTLGSEVGAVLEHDNCPTCHRPLTDALLDQVDSPPIMGVEQSIRHLEGRRQLLNVLAEDAERVLSARRARMATFRARATELRALIRAAQESLVSPDSYPSAAEIERRLLLRSRIESLDGFRSAFQGHLDRLGELANDWRAIAAELLALESADYSEADRAKLGQLEISFRRQIERFGFESCPVDQVILSIDDYMPTHEGFELSLDLSASDAIRVIWAYLLGLMEVDAIQGTNHPGLVVFDEPGQQAMAELSVISLLSEAARIAQPDRQIILAMSESNFANEEFMEVTGAHILQYSGKLLQYLGT